jgi:hypothetical protein
MRRAPTALLASLAAVLLSACDGPLLFAELQVPTVRATMPAQDFPASDTSDPTDWCSTVQTDPPCVQTTVDYDLGGMVPILTDPSVTYDLRLKEVAVTLSATETGKDLGGVKAASITVFTDPADPASAVVIASYVRPAGTVTPTTIAVSGNSNLDLGPYLRGGVLRVHAELVIDKLTPAFRADVTSGLSLEVKLDWGSLL